MMVELDKKELENIDGGCGWCYVGAGLVITGGFLCGGIPGGVVAIVGVAGVALV